jgi:hypothetical protein
VVTQRVFQIASGYEDGNDSNALRYDPLFRLGVNRKPFDPLDALASSATVSRFEHAATSVQAIRVATPVYETFGLKCLKRTGRGVVKLGMRLGP